ncbi:MAG: site-specific DNA-methyltransferase [Deltaproteobacteria bacterium]|nr:site-specific DNA-methyltransferase [Deltaproteobacteria bacterium]
MTGALQKDENGWFYTRGRESSGGSSYLKTYICDNPKLTKKQAIEEANRKRPQTVWSVWMGNKKIAKVFNDHPTGTYAYTKLEKVGYPTQKPEALLKRLIEASTKKDDIVLDAFAGSGTTLAVAEKLDRRWIGIDCGKLAIYTMQKRLLNLKSEIGNKGKKLKPKPFTLYHAGLYDFSKLKKLPWAEWRKFALLLFNCRDNRHTVSGIELDGYNGRSDVLVFDYQKEGGVVLDYGFIDDLHSMIGSKISRHFFIIAPAASVTFLEDYIDKGSVRYYILRIPYSIINELQIKDFEAIKQPIDESQVNDTVDAVGFDFIRQPKVECTYSIEKSKGQLPEYAVIKIKTFKSEAMLKGASQLGNWESLSMVIVDFDYNGEVFNLGKVYYASEIEKNGWKVFLPKGNFKDRIMIIYLDIYGNEYREVKTLQDFADTKQVKRGGK